MFTIPLWLVITCGVIGWLACIPLASLLLAWPGDRGVAIVDTLFPGKPSGKMSWVLGATYLFAPVTLAFLGLFFAVTILWSLIAPKSSAKYYSRRVRR